MANITGRPWLYLTGKLKATPPRVGHGLFLCLGLLFFVHELFACVNSLNTGSGFGAENSSAYTINWKLTLNNVEQQPRCFSNDLSIQISRLDSTRLAITNLSAMDCSGYLSASLKVCRSFGFVLACAFFS